MLPERTVWVEATCGRRALVDEDGDFFLYGRPGECSLKAMRRQGLLTIWGDPITVTVEKNGEHEVQLSVPDWKPAGLGISLEEDEFGIRIARVHPRSPAEKYGLKTGDIILEIDGVSAADLSTHEFVEFGVGPEGTDVDLLVATDDGEHAITLTRGFVEGSDSHHTHEVTGNVHVEELEDGSLEVTRIPEGLSEEEVEDFLQNHPIRRTIPAPTDE
jgi:C-terminal processing protease CtpA/Prc